MQKKHAFNAIIQGAGGGGAYVIVPFDVEKTFGKKRVKIIASIDGERYRGSLVRMNSPNHLLLIRKDIRQKIGKGAGEQVAVTLVEDDQPRVVQVPKDFQKALVKAPAAKTHFEKLSYTHQKEYVQWIESSKKEETRANRIARAVILLESGAHL